MVVGAGLGVVIIDLPIGMFDKGIFIRCLIGAILRARGFNEVFTLTVGLGFVVRLAVVGFVVLAVLVITGLGVVGFLAVVVVAVVSFCVVVVLCVVVMAVEALLAVSVCEVVDLSLQRPVVISTSSKAASLVKLGPISP